MHTKVKLCREAREWSETCLLGGIATTDSEVVRKQQEEKRRLRLIDCQLALGTSILCLPALDWKPLRDALSDGTWSVLC